ncbi:unnamed protein product [Plutella xylostella]|uniref:(diamondback moth) hypothetical protein n=1 Tax=Plutella xylostella TaxID=51655 RepID=A0A8S4GAR2_PLUXY|nr:unnamed protein product [Plutella xylostella]
MTKNKLNRNSALYHSAKDSDRHRLDSYTVCKQARVPSPAALVPLPRRSTTSAHETVHYSL